MDFVLIKGKFKLPLKKVKINATLNCHQFYTVF